MQAYRMIVAASSLHTTKAAQQYVLFGAAIAPAVAHATCIIMVRKRADCGALLPYAHAVAMRTPPFLLNIQQKLEVF